ncbi:MAG TPA: methyltransferase domain-containing protein [Thermoplasmata archaeon]|nr:methyltransferase domain-containing protein [Thermoplasmata archaeon]
MADWDPRQYLRFEAERTQAGRDLVARIELAAPARIVDLGCGPGNSTAVLRARWPNAALVGIDRSPEMLRAARSKYPDGTWIEADLRPPLAGAPYDLVFANAALQWVPDHRSLVPALGRATAEGGALAFQVPTRGDPPPPWLAAVRDLAASPAWRGRLPPDDVADTVLGLTDYYDLLAPLAERVDLWDTEYVHVFPGPEAIVEWTQGTGLRPVLDRLGTDAARADFTAAYARAIAAAYPRRPDGRVLFPFARRFVVAYRR